MVSKETRLRKRKKGKEEGEGRERERKGTELKYVARPDWRVHTRKGK